MNMETSKLAALGWIDSAGRSLDWTFWQAKGEELRRREAALARREAEEFISRMGNRKEKKWNPKATIAQT